jgi:hypothetical protein
MKLLIIFLLCVSFAFSQTVLVNEQVSATSPSTWLTTGPSGWAINNYGVGNARSGAYAIRLSSAANNNGKYLYIPITVQTGYSYTLTFWTKRICGVTINTNETTNQTTLLSSNPYSNSNCSSNFSLWYQWTSTYAATYSGTMYFQILATSVYSGPTSIYIDDVTITENPPVNLPIELLYFNGYPIGSSNHLVWSTASEDNNDYFTIEKTIDGIIYDQIVIIDGAGSSHSQLHYEYFDLNILNIVNYYRLKQTDYDGKFVYSPIISIDNSHRKVKSIVRIINLYGVDTNINSPGVIIIIYDDNTIEKIFNPY